MRKICIFDQKGGVGKTTTAVNLAAGLSREGRKILLIDIDPQGSVGVSLHHDVEKDMYDFLAENARLDQCIKPLGKNLDILPSSERLIKAEAILQKREGSQTILKDKLKRLKGYDYVIIDASPSLSVLNQNALLYSDEVFIPVSTDYLGYNALKKTIEMIATINNVFESSLSITKIVPTLYEKRNKPCREFLDKLKNEFYDLLSEPIRINSKIKEAPKFGKSIFAYDKNCKGALDYLELVKSVMNDEQHGVTKQKQGVRVSVIQSPDQDISEPKLVTPLAS
jgi:chromosome partitioning protein